MPIRETWFIEVQAFKVFGKEFRFFSFLFRNFADAAAAPAKFSYPPPLIHQSFP